MLFSVTHIWVRSHTRLHIKVVNTHYLQLKKYRVKYYNAQCILQYYDWDQICSVVTSVSCYFVLCWRDGKLTFACQNKCLFEVIFKELLIKMYNSENVQVYVYCLSDCNCKCFYCYVDERCCTRWCYCFSIFAPFSLARKGYSCILA